MNTKVKLFIARIIYKILSLLGFKKERIILRNGIKYHVDLSEGIELSLFLFGSFQKYLWKNLKINRNDKITIFDIGANVGSISLPFAKLFPNSKVYSFEPTDYAYSKLIKNIELNPDLKSRIVPIQAFVSKESGISEREEAYSSWKIDGSKVDHPIHGGTLQKATKQQVSIDQFLEKEKITNLKLIKIDVDGFEYEVFQGMQETLKKREVIVIFEFMGHTGPSIVEEFSKYYNLLISYGYTLYDAKSMKILNSENISRIVPKNGGIDILCLPN
jgi:FkbM family methyltransferase